MTLSFQNAGLIDLQAITTFGVNVKETESPIGFFGTGLKFALAITARLGGQVTLYHGLSRIEFKASSLTVRGKEFASLRMVPETGEARDLPFTLDLGKLWEPWMAFREFYCNGMDENEFKHAASLLRPKAGYTTFVIEGCAKMEEAYRNRGQFILETEPAFTHRDCSIHAQKGKGIYYRGVLVKEGATQYSYNVHKQMTLTEDRTLASGWEAYRAIGRALQNCDDSTICTRVINAMHVAGSVESLACDSMHTYDEISKTFLACIKAAHRQRGDSLKATLREMLKQAEPAAYGPKKAKLSAFDNRAIERALGFVEMLYPNVREYPVVCYESLGDGVLGQAENDTIMLSRLVLDKGTKLIASTIIEEYLHLEKGFYDESRQFQDYLLDRYTTLAERFIFGEPL